MTRAYSECYLNDAKRNLGAMLDYAVGCKGIEANLVAERFARSLFAELFECGHPGVVSGMSGIELARKVLGTEGELDDYVASISTPTYWAGYVLAEYQWFTGRRFKDVFARIPLAYIIELYPLFHEMDICRFIEEMERRMLDEDRETNLAWLRENRGFTQARLAEVSGVGLRSIQMYEQRVNDINKAQGITLYRLAHALGCSMDDLLESPLL